MKMQHACRSIAIAGHTGDVDTIQSGLSHSHPRVRVVSLGAASRAGLLDAPKLLPFLADDDAAVIYRALELTATLADGSELSDEVISKLDDPQFSEIAAFALGELALDGERRVRAEQALTTVVDNHDDALTREAAVAALGALGVGVDAIMRAIDDVATVRRRAVIALAPFEGPEVEAALRRAVDDRDWQVRQAAEDLLDPERS